MADAPQQAGVARLFIALWPDDAVREALLAHQRAWVWGPRAARTAPARLHMTLHFLGDIAREQLPSLQAALKVPIRPFEMTLDSDELWPGGIAVLESAQPPPALCELHAQLGDVLRRQQLRCERRPYRAHVTLARRAGGSQPAQQVPGVRWPVHDYTLVESLPGGGAYRTLERYGHS